MHIVRYSGPGMIRRELSAALESDDSMVPLQQPSDIRCTLTTRQTCSREIGDKYENYQ